MAFVRGFYKSITLRVIRSGVAKGDVVFVTEVYHFIGFNGSCIISNELWGHANLDRILFSRKEIVIMSVACLEGMASIHLVK